MLVELWHCMTSTRDFLQKLRLGSLLASQQCKLGWGPLAHLLGIHALCLKEEAKHSIMQYFNMLVINQRNILGSNIRRGNPVTQAGKSCFSLGIWMVFPWCVRGDTWLHAKHQHRTIREKVFTRTVLRLLAFSLQAILRANLSFLVLPWIWQMRELHASTLRWLTQLPFWRRGWKNQSENLRCRDQKDFTGLRNQQWFLFFEGRGACLMRRKAEFLQDFFFSTLTCAAQNSLPA